MLRRLIATLAFALATGVPAVAADAAITVRGEGRVAAAPDLATLSVGVTTAAGTAAEALAANADAMARVLDRLGDEAVAPRDMQTARLDLGPRYADRTGGAPRIDGYVARNVLSVRVRELGRLGAILDAVAADGANTFQGLSFGLAEPGEVEDEALRRAVADARRKADLLAGEAGVSLGAVTSIDMGGGVSRPTGMAEMRSMAADAVPVAEGELTVTATVTVVFAIDG